MRADLQRLKRDTRERTHSSAASVRGTACTWQKLRCRLRACAKSSGRLRSPVTADLVPVRFRRGRALLPLASAKQAPDREGHHCSRRFCQQHGRCGLRRHAEDGAQRFPAAIAFPECALRQRGREDPAADDASCQHETHARSGPRALPAGGQQSLHCWIDRQPGQRICAGAEGGELPERRHAGARSR